MKKYKIQVVIFYNTPSNEKFFLLLQMNEKRNFHWQNITGGVDPGESYYIAAIREAKEETNLQTENIIKVEKTHLIYYFDDQWKNNVQEKVYYIQCKEPWDIKIDPSEHCAFKWVSEKEITRDCVYFENNYKSLLEVLENE